MLRGKTKPIETECKNTTSRTSTVETNVQNKQTGCIFEHSSNWFYFSFHPSERFKQQ